jgi:hypothetical protein
LYERVDERWDCDATERNGCGSRSGRGSLRGVNFTNASGGKDISFSAKPIEQKQRLLTMEGWYVFLDFE